MTPTKAIELAMAQTIRRYADIGAGVTMRAFQSMNFDGSWEANYKGDRKFPMVDIRAAPAITDDSQNTSIIDVIVLCASWIEDDWDNSQMSGIYEPIQTLLDKIFGQFRNGTMPAAEYDYFNARIQEHTDKVSNTNIDGMGGVSFTWGDSLSPYEDNGANVIGVGLKIHYAHTDF